MHYTNNMKKFHLLSILAFIVLITMSSSRSFAQSVGINKDGTTADSSAMLDVSYGPRLVM